MNTISKPSKAQSPKRKKRLKRKKAPKLHRQPPTPLVIFAELLGFLGLIANSILTGNVAYLGIELALSGGFGGWLFGIFAIAISLLSTVTGFGVIFIPRYALAAIRLMALAGLGSLAVGLLLSFLGIRVSLLAGTATVCFWLSAIATQFVRRQRLREKFKKTRGVLRGDR